MKAKKSTKKARAVLAEATGDSRGANATDRKALGWGVKAGTRVSGGSMPESFDKHIQRQTLRAFLDAVKAWRLSDTDAALLVGAEPPGIEEWKTGSASTNEEVLARMAMVALIKTALDIAFSSLPDEWMTLPNGGYPYLGLSPVAYVIEHGWPGLFWVLRQWQAHAVGN